MDQNTAAAFAPCQVAAVYPTSEDRQDKKLASGCPTSAPNEIVKLP